MTELRRTIDEIRFLIENDTFVVTDELTQCASAYAVRCREANVRLRKCEEFLNQGLRSEALHISELAPNLLDLTSQLDFPEREQWVELLAGYSLPLPESLLLDVAGLLNEAYALQEPLQRMLDQHRLYALARSPLPQRLNVLRSLAEFDTTSGHWEPDIREMELARFREIESEARVAMSKGRLDQLKSLVAELNSTQWLETAPANLLRDLKLKGGNAARSQAREQLEMLEEALREAHSSMDLAQARQLRDAWKKQAKIAQLSDQDELSLRVCPVLDWIDDDDRRDAAERTYRRAVAELEQRIDDGTLSSAELQRYGQAVEKCGRGMPEALRSRYRNHVSSLQLGEMRRNRFKIGSIVTSVMGVVGVIGVAVYLGNESQKSRQIIVAVESLIGDAQLDQASKLLDANSARLATDEGHALKKKLNAAQQSEHDRVAHFNSAVNTGRQLDDLVSGEKAIQQARGLARTADEKIVVGNLESAWKASHSAEVARHEQQFRKHVESATAKLRELDGMLASPVAEPNMRAAMESVGSEIAALRVLETKVAPELMSQATLLESRHGSLQKAFADTQRKNSLLEKLSQLVASSAKVSDSDSQVSELRTLLDQFVTTFPNDSRSPGFKGAGNVEAVKAAFGRGKLTAEWKQFWPVDATDVENRLKSCAGFLTDNPASPDRGAIGRYEAFLKSLQWRETGDDDSEQPVRSRLRALFTGKLIKDGHVLRGKDGKSYYLPKETDYTNRKSVTLKYIAGFNDELKSTREIEVDELETLKTEPPPQKVIADHVFQTVSDVTLEAWDPYLQKLAQSLVAAKNVDDFLRYVLLLKTLQHAASGNSLLELELKKTLADLNDSQMDVSASWMDPNDPTAKSSRQLAAVLLKRVTDLDAVWKRAATSQDNLSRELFRQTLPIGWVERTGDRKWILRTHWTSQRKHSLMCVSAAGEDGVRNWLPVGTVQGSAVELDIPTSGGPLEGTIVFASPLPSMQKTASVR